MTAQDPARILPRQTLDFLLYDWLQVERLTGRERFADHDRAGFDGVMDTAARIAAEHFAPHNRKGDLNEPRFEDGKVRLIPEVGEALGVFRDAGFFAPSQDYALGGLQLPFVVQTAAFAWFQAANIATAAYPFLTTAAANLLAAYGSPEQIETYVKPMLEGRFFGTMCLSEPHAGSSLGDITTRAIPQGDGSYRIHGSKMWISGGDHELSETIVHLVLARMEGAPAGVKGISLFVVPRHLLDEAGRPAQRNDVVLAGLNHKMGYRGTVNTLLNFGEGAFSPNGQAGAVGWLVGREGEGLTAMFHMMNEARIGVGASAAALASTGYLHALDYARNRPQGRPVGDRNPLSPQVPIMRHADVRRMLLAQKSYAEGGLALALYSALLADDAATAETEDERRRAGRLLDLLTPVAKSWPSQWGLTANDLAIQIHGGSGYTRDYPVEQFYRDNRLNPIHEGTHGVQGLDLLGRKAIAEGGAGLDLLIAQVSNTARKVADMPDLSQAAGDLLNLFERLRTATRTLWADGQPARALADATLYLEVMGHLVVAWLWLDIARISRGESALHRGKRHAARYFLERELPRTEPMLAILETGDATVLDMPDESF